MKKKIYSSYDEINRDLEILNLERKLHYQKVVRSIEELKDDLTLPNIAQGFLGISKKDTTPLIKVAFKSILPFLVDKVIGLFGKR